MTDRQKEKILLFMIAREIIKNKHEAQIEVETLELLLKLKKGFNFDKGDKIYKMACKEYRKAHKDE